MVIFNLIMEIMPSFTLVVVFSAVRLFADQCVAWEKPKQNSDSKMI